MKLRMSAGFFKGMQLTTMPRLINQTELRTMN